MPTTIRSDPCGNGGASGVPSTSWRAGIGIGASRPGSARSASIIWVLRVEKSIVPSLYGERLMRYTREVTDALDDGRTVVGLESALDAHGLRRPEHLEVEHTGTDDER